MKLKPNVIALLFVIQLFSIQAFGQEETPNFYTFVEKKFSDIILRSSEGGTQTAKGFNFQTICPTDDNFAAKRVFEEYGAIFVANTGVFPRTCIFENESSVQYFQSNANPKTENIGGISITLQTPAMNDLLEARKEAAKSRLAITPRGSIGSKRSYAQTLSLWNSRFLPALN